MVLAICLVGMAARAVETVGADAALGEADALDKVFYLAELKGGEVEAAGDFGNHAVILGSAGSGIGFQLGIVAAFKVADNLTGNQFEIAL